MKVFVVLLVVVSSVLSLAQTGTRVDPTSQIAWPYATGSGAPTAACTGISYGEPYTDILHSTQYVCGPSGWSVVSGTLNYTPLNPANNLTDVAARSTALSNLGGAPVFGLTTLNTSGPATYISNTINIPQYQAALGFTPYNATNPAGYITASALAPYTAWSVGSGPPVATCSAVVNNGAFYTSATLSLYQCSNATGSYAWNVVGGVFTCTGSSCTTSNALTAASLNVVSPRKGTFVCSSGSTIAIANTNYAAASDVIITNKVPSGVTGWVPNINSTTSGTGFTVLCIPGDTSTYSYSILN